MKNKPWTPADIVVLNTDASNAVLAAILKRTPQAVASKRSKIGLRRTKKWTNKDDDALVKNAHKSARKLADELGFSVKTVKRKARALGIKLASPRWTGEELAYLETNYLTMTDRQIGAELGRTPGAVRAQRQRWGWMKAPGNF